jgi:thioredoxin-like negative regulator of GroEL
LRILALATLSNFLQTRPKERLERFVPSIFAEGQGTRQALWETARIYAAADRFEQAIRLGRRALALAVTRKCELAKEVARWCVLIDQPEQAEQVLKDALLSQRERRGEEYLTCLRMYFDLLPDADREHLTAQFVESLRRPSTYRRDALPAVFLLGWSGYKREAALVLDELFRQPAWSGYETWSASDNLGFRTWQFAVEAGQQLIAFQLEPLAEHLWTKLLADRAMIELQGQQSREAVQGLRLRLVQMQLTRAKPSEASAILDRIEAEGDGPAYSVSGLAAQLETARQFRLSALAYRRLYDATPSDPNIYRSLQEVIQRTGDNLLQEDLLSGIAEGRNPPPEGTERWEFVLRLADLYSQTGRPVASKATLEVAAKREPRETRYLEALAKHPEVDAAEAESIWKRLVALEPGRSEYVQALASFYQRSGRTQEALELANAAPPTENRDFSNPQPTAEQLTERAQSFLRRGQPANVGSIATDLRNMGLQNDAIRLMRAAVQTARDPNIKFLLQQQLVTDFLAGGRASIAEDLDYLQELATIHPSLSLQYYQALAKLTKSSSNDAKGRLETAWSDGNPVAGEVLIQLLLSLGQEAEAEKLLDAVVQHPEIADNALSRLQLAFSQGNRPRFAARVIEEQIARNRGDLRFQFALCNQLWKAGEKARVSAIVEDVAKRAPVQNDILPRIANFFSSGRDPDLARQWLERAIGADPDAARSDLRVQYARLLIEQGRLARARRVLRSVEPFRTDSVFNDYIELSTRAGLADEWYGEIPFLWRSTARSVWTANFEHWLKEGATDRAAKALETYPGFARGALKYGPDLLTRAPASTAKVLEAFFSDAILEKNESEEALQLADEAQQRNRELAVKALEAVIRSSRNDLSERARARLTSMH